MPHLRVTVFNARNNASMLIMVKSQFLKDLHKNIKITEEVRGEILNRTG